MEMADIIAINKSDGDNIDRSKIAKSEIERAIHFFQPKDSGWQTTVDLMSSVNGNGIEQIWKRISEHAYVVNNNGWFDKNRKEQIKLWFYDDLNSRLLSHFNKNENFRKLIREYENKIVNGKMLPGVAISELLKEILEN